MKQQSGETVCMSLLVGVLFGVGLVAFAIISTKSALDATLPHTSGNTTVSDKIHST